MVQMYTLVLVPSKEALEKLDLESQPKAGRVIALVQARERTEWEKWRSERQRKREDVKEAQRGRSHPPHLLSSFATTDEFSLFFFLYLPSARTVAFAQIDWQDFVVVENIEFTSEDEAIQLELPTSITALDSLTLAQKMMASTLGEQPLRASDAAKEEQPEEDMEMDMD